jgi:hypothetical protein
MKTLLEILDSLPSLTGITDRYTAIIDAYMTLFDKHDAGVTIEEVAQWSIDNGLYPVPLRAAQNAVVEAWNAKFRLAVAAETERRKSEASK